MPQIAGWLDAKTAAEKYFFVCYIQKPRKYFPEDTQFNGEQIFVEIQKQKIISIVTHMTHYICTNITV